MMDEVASAAAMRALWGGLVVVSPPPKKEDPKTTTPLYLGSTYLYEAEAFVVRATESEVVLTATIFHPHGGGQPCDFGTIATTSGVFVVSDVRRVDAVVVHSGLWQGASAASGARASMRVDAKRRDSCARLHSAGHAIDAAMDRAGCELVPAKGYHFPDGGAYVEYDGRVEDTASLVASLNDHLAHIIREDTPVLTTTDVVGLRVVTIAGKSCPCGGTHVESTKQLLAVTVTKAKHKAKRLRISYSVGGS